MTDDAKFLDLVAIDLAESGAGLAAARLRTIAARLTKGFQPHGVCRFTRGPFSCLSGAQYHFTSTADPPPGVGWVLLGADVVEGPGRYFWVRPTP